MTEDVAFALRNRAIRVENERQDPISMLARGVLGMELTIANRLLEKKFGENIPEELRRIQQNGSGCGIALEKLILSIQNDYFDINERTDIASLPKPNICGYTANAITEVLKENGIESTVVIGHFISPQKKSYHYYTEAKINGNVYVLDRTYGQFDPTYKDKILICSPDQYSQMGVTKFDPSKPEVFRGQSATYTTLIEQGGLLPIKDDIRSENTLAAYNNLVAKLR